MTPYACYVCGRVRFIPPEAERFVHWYCHRDDKKRPCLTFNRIDTWQQNPSLSQPASK